MSTNKTILFAIYRRIPELVLFIGFILVYSEQCSCAISGKVVEFGDKLPDYLKQHPHKGWLIKFYTPWCYNCQQIELTYIEVAERIYHAHDHLIVGQVNCDKYDAICRRFNVQGVPTILYLKGNQQSSYNGLREVNSIVSFAERMNGPDINVIHDCNQITPELERRGLIILHSTHQNTSPLLANNYHKEFNSIAAQLKRDFWFYKIYNRTCGTTKQGEGIHIIKRNLRRWIKFEPTEDVDPEASLREFISRESFSVFGPLSNHMMNTTKVLAVAVLDQYGPAKKLHTLSKKFHKVFEQVAIKEAQENDDILFAWSTDVHTIKKIALSHVQTPNVIVLKPDLSYHLLIKLYDSQQHANDVAEKNEQLPEALTERAVLQFIKAARKNELRFSGGDTYYHRLARYIYSYVILVKDRYEANPVLTSLMFISLATTLIMLLYKARTFLRDDEEDIDFEPQSNHKKQD